jgi:hypothetical protein
MLTLEKRLAHLRADIAQADPGLWLTDEQFDAIITCAIEALMMLYGSGAEDDSHAINVLCDLIEPYLTLIVHGGPVCNCTKPCYYAGKKIDKSRKPAA